MESKSISKSSLVNLALEILRPRLTNAEATDHSIREAIMYKTINEDNLPY